VRATEAPTTGTARQLEVLRAVLLVGSIRAAAADLGLSEQTVKNHLRELHTRYGATSTLDVARDLGWVSVPSPDVCGWTGHCHRPPGHRGHHGGFRP
jgi:DNA-binding CsgD family transcriptional regulator